ncbi:MAG: hypothetical protein HXX80_04525 [Nitrososphaerales archaeon]|nr:hypothetical protein [Nitrososphaerales archaeon]
MNPFRSLMNDGKDETKDRLSLAIKRLEIHKITLKGIRERLERRYEDLQIMATRECGKDRSIAKIYDEECSELRSAIQTVAASELTLTQVTIRLGTLKDIGEIIHHLSSALKIMKEISSSMSKLRPSLEGIVDDFNSTMNTTLVELKGIPTPIDINIETKDGTDIVERAIRYVEEKAMEEEISEPILSRDYEAEKRVTVLATGEAIDEPELLNHSNIDEAIMDYIRNRKGEFSFSEVSTLLNIPMDEVKRSILRLLTEDRKA